MRNGGGVSLPLYVTVSSEPFRKGFNDARKGIPLDPEAFPAKPSTVAGKTWQANDQWQYERGRLFYYVFRRSFIRSGKPTKAAIAAYTSACLSREIV